MLVHPRGEAWGDRSKIRLEAMVLPNDDLLRRGGATERGEKEIEHYIVNCYSGDELGKTSWSIDLLAITQIKGR